MSIQLLNNSRKLRALLLGCQGQAQDLLGACEAIAEDIFSQVFVLDHEGRAVAVATSPMAGALVGPDLEGVLPAAVGELACEQLIEGLHKLRFTKENIQFSNLGVSSASGGSLSSYCVMVVPLEVANQELGYFVVYRRGIPYNLEDVIYCEYVASMVAQQQSLCLGQESTAAEEGAARARAALNSLSVTELRAVKCVFAELHGMEGMIISSRISQAHGITRSLIVNALRKLESAGLIESRSSGMKGTYVKVINKAIFSELSGSQN